MKGESGMGWDGPYEWTEAAEGTTSLSVRRCKLNAVKHLECVRVKRGIRAKERGRRRNNVVFLRMEGDEETALVLPLPPPEKFEYAAPQWRKE